MAEVVTESKELYTLREVADKFKIDYDIVREAVYSGRWPHQKFSARNRRMTQADVDRVLEMTRHEPVASTPSDAHQRRKAVRALVRSI